MAAISRNVLSYKPVCPPWFLAMVLIGSFIGSVFFYAMEPIGGKLFTDAPIITAFFDPSSTTSAMHMNRTEHPFGFLLIGFCVVVQIFSALIFFREFPVLLLSSSEERVARAAGLVETTLLFIVVSFVVIIAALAMMG
jgi:hypothetical protein